MKPVAIVHFLILVLLWCVFCYTLWHSTSLQLQSVVHKMKNHRLQCCQNNDCACYCAVFRGKKKKNHSENFKALLLNIWQVSAHLLNAFRALVITTMGTYRKLWLQYFELSCNTKQDRSLDASVIIFLSRKKEKKKK